MALVSDLVKLGISAQQAKALGDTFATVAAAGTTINDATSVTDSILRVSSSSGANAGIKLPTVEMSNTKRHIVVNETAGNIRVYVGDGATESIVIFNGVGGSATFITVASLVQTTLIKIAANVWGAFA